MDPSLSESAYVNELCDTCQSLLVRREMSIHTITHINYSRDTLLASTSSTCSICFWVLEWASTWPISIEELVPPMSLTASLAVGECEIENDTSRIGTGQTDVFRVKFELSFSSSSYEAPILFELILREYVYEDSETRMKLQTNADLYGRPTIKASASALASTTQHESCLSTVKTWMKMCEMNHQLCNIPLSSQSPSWLPTRLIDIYEHRLVITSSLPRNTPRIRYITLSHRWNHLKMPRLLQKSLKSLLKGIEGLELPPVFRDTFHFAGRLEVPYVWIDALCIVQDDPEDCAKEIATMGDVYQNAYCNLGAYSAADEPNAGLYSERDSRHIQVHKVPLLRSDFQGSFLAHPYLVPTILASSTLMGRGWVFQERLLSTRSIYFGERLQWECTELQACETFPEGPPITPFLCPWGIDGHPFRLANMLCQGLRYQGSARQTHVFGDWRPKPSDLQVDETPFELMCLSESTRGGQKERELALKWLFLVQLFSGCCFSFEEDTLPALSGLALIYQRFTQDQYVAGIWKNNLLQGLLWVRSRNVAPQYPEKYRAPSWSWAAMSCEIYFPLLNDLNGMIYEDIWVAEVIEASVQIDGPDPMGRVASGFICLSSNLQQTKSIFWIKEGASGRMHLDWIDNSAPTSGPVASNKIFHLLLGYRRKRHDDGAQEIIDVHGLIVEQVTKCRFRRLGAFQHGWHQGGLDDTGQLPLFVDFDPHHFERTRVILV